MRDFNDTKFQNYSTAKVWKVRNWESKFETCSGSVRDYKSSAFLISRTKKRVLAPDKVLMLSWMSVDVSILSGERKLLKNPGSFRKG